MTPADSDPAAHTTVTAAGRGEFAAWVDGDGGDRPAAGPVEPPCPAGYVLEAEIAPGQGNMGRVYKARSLALNRAVAVKMLPPDRHPSAKEQALFLAEAAATAAIDHPHVVRVFESGLCDGKPYFVMEYVPGGSLADRLTAGRLPPRAAAGVVRKLAEGVQAAHDVGLVHRDIKPSNVLLARPATGLLDPAAGDLACPKLADFGLARRAEDLLATHGGAAGTPHYMSPEQFRGDARRVGVASDVWALGVVLYKCLTGAEPFPGTGVLDVARAVEAGRPPPPRAAAPGVPRDLELVCLKCLEGDPHRRYPTALAVAEELGRFLAGEPVRVRPTTAPERCLRWARKRPAVAGLSAAVVLLLFALTALATREGRRAVRERDALRAAQQETLAARDEAVAARNEAEGRALASEWQAYVGRVQAAAARWADAHPAEARRLLDDCPAEWRGWEHAHLSRLADPDRGVLLWHPAAAAVAAPADGRVVTAGGDMVRVWQPDGSPGPAVAVGPHTAAAVSADGRRAAVGDAAGTVSVWDLAAGRRLFTRPAHPPGGVAGLAFCPKTGRLASAGRDGCVRVWGPLGLSARRQPLLADPLTCVAWRPDGGGLAAGGRDGSVVLWAADARPPRPAAGGDGAVAALAYSPRVDLGGVLAVARPGRVDLLDPADGRPRADDPIDLPDDPAAVAVTADAVHVAAGRVVRAFARNGGRPLGTFRGPDTPVVGLAAPPDRVLVLAAGGAVREWHPGRPEHGLVAGGAGDPVLSAAFAPAGGLVAVTRLSALARRVEQFAPAGGRRPVPPGEWPEDEWPEDAAGTPDGAVVVATAGGRVVRFDPAGGRRELLPDQPRPAPDAPPDRPDPHSPTGTRLDPAGRFAARGWADGSVTVWELTPDLARRRWHAGAGPAVLAVRVEPAAGLVLAADAAGRVAGYDLATGAERWAVTVGGAAADDPAGRRMAVCPAGRRLAAAAGDRVRVWDLGPAGPRERQPLIGHAGDVRGVGFGPDGSRLASAGADGTVRVWDVPSGSELLALRGHDKAALAVEFGPDGRSLLSVGADGAARVWEAAPAAPAAGRRAAAARLARVPATVTGVEADRLRELAGSP